MVRAWRVTHCVLSRAWCVVAYYDIVPTLVLLTNTQGRDAW
jgi:hypothetical protein